MINLKRNILIILGCVAIAPIFMASGTVKARQTDTEVWYWAYNDSQIIAYTVNGQTKTVYEKAGEFGEQELWGKRLASDRVILSNRSNVMRLLIGPDDVLDIANSEWVSYFFPVDYHRPYLIGVSGGPGYVPFKITNIETGRAHQLNGYLLDLYYEPSVGKPIFLPNSDSIRYFSMAERGGSQGNIGTLWELDLVTGEEKILATIPFVPTRYFASPNGSQWWFFRHTNTEKLTVTFGSITPETTELLASGLNLWGEYVVDYRTENILLYSIANDETLSYPMIPHNLYIYHLYSDQSLLVVDDSFEIWQLDPAGTAKSLGWLPLVWVDPFEYQMGGEGFLSNDGRWVLVSAVDAEKQPVQLWDMERREVVLEALFGGNVLTRFTDELVLIRDIPDGRETSEKASAYLINKDQTIILPEATTGHWIDVMTGSKLLYEEYGNLAERQPGLYAYDIFSETFTLLVPDAKPVILRPTFNLLGGYDALMSSHRNLFPE
ncbi:MAG: hypothetical protein K8L91_20145 [Anaerolineae bacterium]|nr:hypothetical protein [Anaerolineae bacterium]